ncbi:peroxidase domain-containing protein [Phthorimaea operculella]|nr:peroxidase domain-containing protein [Phthorimaea operculella]
MILFVVLLFCGVALGEKRVYDTYSARPLTFQELVSRRNAPENNTYYCTAQIEDCHPHEGRRLDGSCNNLKYFTRGAAHTPFYRVLPAAYGKDFEPRKSKSGDDLPLARQVRTSLLSEGKVPDSTFTQLLTHYWVWMASDTVASDDTFNYVQRTDYCCTERGKTEYMCTPNKIPNDDPVHRFNDNRCQNMTRPLAFQTYGCVAKDTSPERINRATPVIDLSNLYGAYLNISLDVRMNEGGLLKYEEEGGKIWPPSAPNNGICKFNQSPKETRCHAPPNTSTNTLLGMNLNYIWFWRQHNKIARELAEINPCWDNDKLFYTARDINIAIGTQIYLYELLPLVMGKENLIKDNIISPTQGFRDFYNPEIPPQLSLEYPYALRWVHTIQETTMKMFDPQGNQVKTFNYVDLVFRTGYLAVDDNIDLFTQGAFRQPCGKFDYIVDPDMSENGLGAGNQRTLDILTNDVAKTRYFGFQPYVNYREFCSKIPHKSWDDLKYVIDEERIVKLKELYKNVEDIDLLAGMWVEKFIEGGVVPPTFYCLVVDQLQRNLAVDRHFYERPNRPNAFTPEQLGEIRKSSMSGVLCNVGDSVTQIQPHSFLREGPGNEFVPCEQIPKVDLNAWKDNKCAGGY